MNKLFALTCIITFLTAGCQSAAGENTFQGTSVSSATADGNSFTQTPVPAPTNTSTLIPSPTPTMIPEPVVITIDNIIEMRRLSVFGKEDTFIEIKDFVLSPSGKYLCISGVIDSQMTTRFYDTGDFEIISSFPGYNKPAWTSDETKLVLANENKIEIRDFMGAVLERTLELSYPVHVLAVGDQNIAIVDGERQLIIFDVNSGDEKFKLQLPESTTELTRLTLNWSPNGQYLAVANLDSTVRVWDGETVHELKQDKGDAMFRSWSPDSEFLATSSTSDPYIYEWRLSNFNLIEKHFVKYWGTASWSPDGKIFAIADLDGTIDITDSRSGKMITQFFPKQTPDFLIWSPDSKYLVSQGNQFSQIKIFDVPGNREIAIPQNTLQGIKFLRWMADSNKIIFSNVDSRVQTLNLELGEANMIIDPEIGSIVNLYYSSDGQRIALAERGGTIKIFSSDFTNKLMVIKTEFPYPSLIENMRWSMDDSILAIADTWGQLKTYSSLDGKEMNQLPENNKYSNPVYSWNPTKNILLVGDYFGNMILWEPTTNIVINSWQIEGIGLTPVAWSADGSKAGALVKKVLYIWETKNWQTTTAIPITKNDFNCVQLDFIPDQNNILLYGYIWRDLTFSTMFLLVDIPSQKIIAEWEGESYGYIALSPDGNLVASGTGEIWDLLNLELIDQLKLDDNYERVTWSPDGKNLVFYGNKIENWGVIP